METGNENYIYNHTKNSEYNVCAGIKIENEYWDTLRIGKKYFGEGGREGGGGGGGDMKSLPRCIYHLMKAFGNSLQMAIVRTIRLKNFVQERSIAEARYDHIDPGLGFLRQVPLH